MNKSFAPRATSWISWLVLGCVCGTTPLRAQEEPAREVAPGEEVTASVLVRLQTDKDAFEQFMERTLSPQLQRIGEGFSDQVRLAEEALERLRRDPRNEALRGAYEDRLSEAVVRAGAFLHEFGELEEGAFESLDNLAKTLQEAERAFTERAEESRGRRAALDRQTAETAEALAELAERFRSQLEAHESLPPDVDLMVRLLQVDLETARGNAAIARLEANDAVAATAELAAQREKLSELRGDLMVAFRQGEGQHMLLGNLARMKQARLQSRSVYKQLEAVSEVVAARKTDLGRIGALVDRIVRGDLASPKTTAVAESSDRNDGRDILRAHLKRGDDLAAGERPNEDQLPGDEVGKGLVEGASINEQTEP